MIPEDFDADKFYNGYNKEEQDKVELEEGLANKAQSKLEDDAADKADYDRDEDILRYFDTKFTGEPIENKYQFTIPEINTESYHSRVFSALYILIREQRTVYVYRRNKPTKILLEPDVPHQQYVNELLNHHFDFCKGNKLTFLYKLQEGIKNVAFIFKEHETFKGTIGGSEFDIWLTKKRNKIPDRDSVANTSKGKLIPKSWIDLFRHEYQPYAERFKKLLSETTGKGLISEDLKKWTGLKYLSRLYWELLEDAEVAGDFYPANVAIVFAAEFEKLSTDSFVNELNEYSKGVELYKTELIQKIDLLKNEIEHDRKR